MRLLLDTFALIYALTRPDDLGTEARGALVDTGADVYFSPASVWEIEIKTALGKLPPVAADIATAARVQGFSELAIVSAHAQMAGRLPLLHRDPFDRMLVAQALVEGLTVVTPDELFASYGVPVMRC